jgi:26S proteasome regulatory subunit N1
MVEKKESEAIKIPVRSDDPKKDGADTKKKDKKKKKEELSEEDKAKKAEFELLAERAQDSDQGIARTALQKIVTELKTSTSSMCSVPKPLKFMRQHYPVLAEHYKKLPAGDLKCFFADVLSVLATTMQEKGSRMVLKYRMEGTKDGFTSWGHEYMRNLSAEISEQYKEKTEKGESVVDLTALIDEIVPFYMKHNAEIDAIDLLCEVDQISKITDLCDERTFSRVSLYLLGLSNFAATQSDKVTLLKVTYDLYMKAHQANPENAYEFATKADQVGIDIMKKKHGDNFAKMGLEAEQWIQAGCEGALTAAVSTPSFVDRLKHRAAADETKYHAFCIGFKDYLKRNASQEYPNALRVALKLNDASLVKEVFSKCEDRLVKKQMAFMISRHKFNCDFDGDEELKEIASADSRSGHYLNLAKELDVLEPKLPEQIYKSHLEEKRSAATAVLDSAKQNLASSFVNAFVNAGFCKDELMSVQDSKWVYKNKEHGQTSTVATLGCLYLWAMDEGLGQIDKYQYSTDVHLQAGALMSFGLVTCGLRNECDPAWALLGEQLEAEDAGLRLAAVVGLGHAYSGTCREDLLENLTPMIVDTACTIECSAMAAVSLGLIFVSSCNDEVAQAILQTLIERQAVEGALSGTWPHFFAVGLGLLYLGQQDAVEATLAALDAISHPVGKYAKLTVEGMAFANSGDVLHVQKMFHCCTEHLEEAESFHQAAAVIGLAMISFGEDVGSEMTVRALDHILQYGELTLRRAVPLALGLLHISNPKVTVIDTLSKLSHDADQDVALGAIFSMGILGAGTNNARLAGLLRQLAAYYAKDSNALFMVRVSQGLLYMGKGLLSLNPIFSDRLLCDQCALGSLLVLMHAVLHLKNTILAKSHYLLFHVVPAMHPRWLITLDEDLKEIKVPVRVGQAVDTVGQAGRPRNITGFQTRTTPVLLNYGDRAELATEEYLSVATILEDVVILRKNPNYQSGTV